MNLFKNGFRFITNNLLINMNTLIRILLFIFFLISNNIISNAQPSITWQRLYNGPSNTHDNGRGICETANGNIYLTGFFPSPKAVVLKLKPNGDTLWTKYFDNIRGDFILPHLTEVAF